MSGAPEGGKRIGKAWYVLTVLLVIATAIWAFLLPKRPARKPIQSIVSQLEHGDPSQRMATLRGLYVDVAGQIEFAQVLPYVIRATKDESEMVRHEAASVLGELTIRYGFTFRYGATGPRAGERDPVIAALCPEANEALAKLLDETSPTLRSRAAKSLGFVAEVGRLGAPPPRLLACLDDESEEVRAAAAGAVIAYRQGPELLVPVALRRIPGEGQVARESFMWVFWQVRLEPSVLPLLIDGLSSEHREVRLACTAAINHMGRGAGPGLPAILTVLRKELESPEAHPMIIAMAAGAIGEISPDGDPDPGTIELLCRVLKGPGEERQAEAAWSLGIFGRSAASAVPLLIASFEAAPKAANSLRQVTAEALVEITRGTPDADRVITSLAKAWKTAPEQQQVVLARALRSLGPKSETFVPELKRLPADTTPSQIRRVRYPRTRFEEPVRE
jgi:HEAT repeat protein